MPIRLSKAILLLEALLLMLPIGILFMTLLPGAVVMLFNFGSVASPAASVLVFLMGAALVAAVRVIAAFCEEGASGLRRVHRRWWWLCVAGALISVAGLLAVLWKKYMSLPGNDLTFVLKLAVYGLPLLIPLSHVALELLFRRGTDDLKS